LHKTGYCRFNSVYLYAYSRYSALTLRVKGGAARGHSTTGGHAVSDLLGEFLSGRKIYRIVFMGALYFRSMDAVLEFDTDQ
jgi:hypothetical protein